MRSRNRSEGLDISVSEVYPGGPADKAGISQGNPIPYLLEVDGIRVSFPGDILEGHKELAKRVKVGTVLTYSAGYLKSPTQYQVRIEAPPKVAVMKIASYRLSRLGYGLISFLIGFFVWWRRPRDEVAFAFFLVCAGVAWFYVLSIGFSPSLDSLTEGLGVWASIEDIPDSATPISTVILDELKRKVWLLPGLLPLAAAILIFRKRKTADVNPKSPQA